MLGASWKLLFKLSHLACQEIHFAAQKLTRVRFSLNLSLYLCHTNLSSFSFKSFIHFKLAVIGSASELLNEWADEDAGIEAVQKITDTLDDIASLQDSQVDPDVLISLLRDTKLHMMLQVRFIIWCSTKKSSFSLTNLLYISSLLLFFLHNLWLFIWLLSSYTLKKQHKALRSYKFTSDVSIESASRWRNWKM